MFLRKANSKWIVRTPAKLNVYLSIEGRRPDGYHELQTLMVPISLFDTLVIEPIPATGPSPSDIRFELVEEGSPAATCSVPSDGTNLVIRALDALRQRTGCQAGADVALTKRIPAGAGLGGGSSDAAAALVAANAAWGLGLARRDLHEVARSLGSDVPFFLACRPAVCTGRGDVLAPLAKCGRLHAIVVTPRERLATAKVYAALRASDFAAQEPARASSLAQLAQACGRGDVGTIGRLLYNGLARAALSLEPGLARVEHALARVCGPSVMMSGSGSSFFGLCRTAREARRGAAYLHSAGFSSAVAAATYT